MKYQPEKHHRRSIRMREFDYSAPGAYFITLCTQNRKCLFGEIMDAEIRLSDMGRMVFDCWRAIPMHYPVVQLDEFTVMPNHVHGIIVIGYSSPVGVQNFEPRLPDDEPRPGNLSIGSNVHRYQKIIPKSVGTIVRGFKIGVTKWCRQNTQIQKPWQRNYWERVIRDDTELNRTREYIRNNPFRWEIDSLRPSGIEEKMERRARHEW